MRLERKESKMKGKLEAKENLASKLIQNNFTDEDSFELTELTLDGIKLLWKVL